MERENIFSDNTENSSQRPEETIDSAEGSGSLEEELRAFESSWQERRPEEEKKTSDEDPKEEKKTSSGSRPASMKRKKKNSGTGDQIRKNKWTPIVLLATGSADKAYIFVLSRNREGKQ